MLVRTPVRQAMKTLSPQFLLASRRKLDTISTAKAPNWADNGTLPHTIGTILTLEMNENPSSD